MTAKLRQAFASQKCAARRRGIEFLFSYEEWLTIWLGSGYLSKRGRNRDSYCMARFNDKGAYAVGNVKIVPVHVNGEEQVPRLGWNHSIAARERLSLYRLGKKLPISTRQKMRSSRLGKKHSEETKLKISKSHFAFNRMKKLGLLAT